MIVIGVSRGHSQFPKGNTLTRVGHETVQSSPLPVHTTRFHTDRLRPRVWNRDTSQRETSPQVRSFPTRYSVLPFRLQSQTLWSNPSPCTCSKLYLRPLTPVTTSTIRSPTRPVPPIRPTPSVSLRSAHHPYPPDTSLVVLQSRVSGFDGSPMVGPR